MHHCCTPYRVTRDESSCLLCSCSNLCSPPDFTCCRSAWPVHAAWGIYTQWFLLLMLEFLFLDSLLSILNSVAFPSNAQSGMCANLDLFFKIISRPQIWMRIGRFGSSRNKNILVCMVSPCAFFYKMLSNRIRMSSLFILSI